MAQPNAVDIFPQGDVVLVCGEKENTKRYLGELPTAWTKHKC